MKRFIVVCLSIFLLSASVSKNAAAGGIPTFDGIAVGQRMIVLIKEIQKYQEMIKQSTKMSQQYLQLVRTYQQKLIEYRHYLNQLKGLKSKLSDGDWLYLMRFIRQHGFYGRSRLAQVHTMDPDDAEYRERLEEALSDYGYIPRPPIEVEADATELGIWSDKLSRAAKRDWNNYQRYEDQMETVTRNTRKYDKYGDILETHQKVSDGLGDEDELSTHQARVRQGITQIDQGRETFNTLNQILYNLQQESARDAAIQAQERDREIERLKNRTPSSLLGRDTILP